MGNPRNRSRKRKRTGAPKKPVDVEEYGEEVNDSNASQTDSSFRTQHSSSLQPICSSAKKKKEKLIPETPDKDYKSNEIHDNPNDFNLIINFETLEEIFSLVAVCPECQHTSIHLQHDVNKQMGFNCRLKLTCRNCKHEISFQSSKDCINSGSGRPFAKVNSRSVIAFREIGRGHEALKNFARCMNMPCMTVSAFDNINDEIFNAYESVCLESMKNAANEVIESGAEKIPGYDVAITQCSLYGTWQKRGHSSLNGVVTAIANGKCIDHQVLSKYCRGCKKWEGKRGTPQYDRWFLDHKCQKNHAKSSGAMESVGAIDIVSRSIEKNSLVYGEYIGDGDTASFKDVVQSQPYRAIGIIPKKLECIGHVQKRLGTRLRKLRNEHKSKKPSLSGKGKLTDKAINAMQNYFGMAVRSNKGNLYQMKKAIGAVLWHCTIFEDEFYRHRFCPEGDNSWCKWKRKQLKPDTQNQQYKGSVNIPVWIHNIIRPIFTDLSDDELLSKCLHGKTQNDNESLNHMIWNKCPKNVFVKLSVLQLGVFSAVIEFNDGAKGVERVLKNFMNSTGVYTTLGSYRKDKDRSRQVTRKASESEKRRRKKLRSIHKGFLDAEKDIEGKESYLSGAY